MVQDLITLPHLHEPALLHSLTRRFAEGAIYTFTGACMFLVFLSWMGGWSGWARVGSTHPIDGQHACVKTDRSRSVERSRARVSLTSTASSHPLFPTSILFGPARPAGPILIALNPFKRLPLYTEGTLMTYFEQVGEAASLCWLVCVLGGYNEKCIISIYYCTRASQKVVSQHDHPHHTPARIPHTTPPPPMTNGRQSGPARLPGPQDRGAPPAPRLRHRRRRLPRHDGRHPLELGLNLIKVCR